MITWAEQSAATAYQASETDRQQHTSNLDWEHSKASNASDSAIPDLDNHHHHHQAKYYPAQVVNRAKYYLAFHHHQAKYYPVQAVNRANLDLVLQVHRYQVDDYQDDHHYQEAHD